MLRRLLPAVTRSACLHAKSPVSRPFVTSSSILSPINSTRLSFPKATSRKMSAPEQAGSAENLRPDPVTGEMISKSELKRREKQRAKEAAKAEKKAAAPAPAAGEKKEKNEKDNEEELDAGVSARHLQLYATSDRLFSPTFTVCSNTMRSDARRSWPCENPRLRTLTRISSMSPSLCPTTSKSLARKALSRTESDLTVPS